MPQQRTTLTCAQCHRSFAIPLYRLGEAKFCSMDCRRNATPTDLPIDSDRFWARVNKDGQIPEWAPHLGPCWLWEGRVNTSGYGVFKVKIGGTWSEARSHRLAMELSGIVIPDGLMTDHLCRIRRCVRPSHLQAVDNRTNTLRGFSPVAKNARKTHCSNGHPFTEENTRKEKDRYRRCIVCARAVQRRRYPGKQQSSGDACKRGHVGEMRICKDGKRRCHACAADRDRLNYQKRKMQRVLAKGSADGIV